MIKLYGVPASRASRCLWMLEELGVPYENVPTSFVGDAKKPEYLAKNPNGRVPTLEDDDLVVWESMAINLHLAEKYDAGLRPKSLAERAHAVQWSFWGMTEIEPGLIDAFVQRVMVPEAKRDAAIADAGEKKLQRPLAVLDAHLAGRSWLLGDRFTLADLNLASVLAIAPIARIDLGRFPNVQRWLEACLGPTRSAKGLRETHGLIHEVQCPEESTRLRRILASARKRACKPAGRAASRRRAKSTQASAQRGEAERSN